MRRHPAGVLLFFLPVAAHAHAGEKHLAEALWSWWTWDPLVLLTLTASAWLYIRGLRHLWARAGVGQGIGKWEAGAFAAGWLSLVVALVSPLDGLSDVLFSAHMAQHEVLMLISAPLLVLGRSLLGFLWAFSPERRERIGSRMQSPRVIAAWHALTGALAVWVLHGTALWIWHVPSLYEAALEDDFVHGIQHLCFFVTAALFWWALVHGRFGRIGYGVAVFYVFTTALHSSILGALLTFAPRLWYPMYEARTMRWNLDALQDQQLAGLLMWIPAGVIFLVLGLALFAAWLGQAERRVALTRSEALARAAGGADEV